MYHLFTLVIHLSARLLIQSCILIVHPLAAASSYLNSMAVTAPDCLRLGRLSRLSLWLRFRGVISYSCAGESESVSLASLSDVTASVFSKRHVGGIFILLGTKRGCEGTGCEKWELRKNIKPLVCISCFDYCGHCVIFQSFLGFVPASSYIILLDETYAAA